MQVTLFLPAGGVQAGSVPAAANCRALACWLQDLCLVSLHAGGTQEGRASAPAAGVRADATHTAPPKCHAGSA